MVSINLSDFFHDILLDQAFRPVSIYRDQWVPSLSVGSLKVLGQMKSPPDAPQEKGDVWVNVWFPMRSFCIQTGFEEPQVDQWGISEVSIGVNVGILHFLYLSHCRSSEESKQAPRFARQIFPTSFSPLARRERLIQ